MTGTPSALERLLLRDGIVAAASLLGLTALCWFYLVVLAVRMMDGDMSLMGMSSMAMDGLVMGRDMALQPQPWTGSTFVLMVLMWWVMMIGMMVPSAAPIILIYGRIQRKKLPDENPAGRSALFCLGYLLVWFAFSAAATLLQWRLGEASMLSPMMASNSSYLAAFIFAAAGLYQLTPVKQSCLIHCRSPIHFLSTHWRDGDAGALRMGLGHGAYCVGCCWVLMVLLFIGGVMNLLWVGAIALLVLLEKILPQGL